MEIPGTELESFLSCNQVLTEWARFGLSGLVILALLVLVGWMLNAQKLERELWKETLDNNNKAIIEATTKLCTLFERENEHPKD